MLAAVLTAAQAQGREGKAVRALGEELGVPVRIRPPLPLGRAAAHPPALESHTSLEEDGAEVLAQRTEIHVTCGLGMNVYIAPDGACYPCYALHGRAFCLGNAIGQGLKEVIASERFQALRAKTVDTTPHCRACPWRWKPWASRPNAGRQPATTAEYSTIRRLSMITEESYEHK
jgi:radical SAM protein with 4Fe4S-binding SPASM domain